MRAMRVVKLSVTWKTSGLDGTWMECVACGGEDERGRRPRQFLTWKRVSAETKVRV